MDERRLNPIVVGCLAVVGFLSVGAIVFFAAVLYGLSSGRLASTEALPKGKIPARQVQEIANLVGLRPNEQILYFYSAAMTVSGDGNLFTNERVVSYTTDYGPLEVFDADYDEIESATLTRSTTWLGDSTLDVLLKDGTTITLWVSAENDRDKDFHAKLMHQLELARAE